MSRCRSCAKSSVSKTVAVEEELITRLLGFADLAAFTGQRVYFIARPQGDALPSVTLQLAGGGRRESAMGGDTGYQPGDEVAH